MCNPNNNEGIICETDQTKIENYILSMQVSVFNSFYKTLTTGNRPE